MHIDGYDMLPYLAGDAKDSPRREFFYVNDDGERDALLNSYNVLRGAIEEVGL